MKNKGLLFIFFLILGVSFIQANICIDSDEGQDFYKKGSVTIPGQGLMDYCNSSVSDTLVERTCSSTNESQDVFYACPNGCSNGACIGPIEPNPSCSENYTFGIATINDNDGNPELVLREIDTGYSISFSVGSIKNKGNIEITAINISDDDKTATLSVASPGIFDFKAEKDHYTYEIINSNMIFLNEDNDDYFVVSYCPNSNEVPLTCTDSDGGQNFYVNGNVSVDGQIYYDACSGSKVQEMYCKPGILDKYWINDSYTCPDGCESGVCVSVMTDCTTVYAPVCGLVQIQCVTTPCEPIYTTFGNRCELDGNKLATFVHEGECLINETNSTNTFNQTSCDSIGLRKNGKYCSSDSIWLEEKDTSAFCENNFECISNVCVSSECISEGFIQKILNWFKNLFG